MAISAINNSANVSFKGNGIALNEDNENDKKILNLREQTAKFNDAMDSFFPSEEGKENKKKNLFETAFAIGVAAVSAYTGALVFSKTAMSVFGKINSKAKTTALQAVGDKLVKNSQAVEGKLEIVKNSSKPAIQKAGNIIDKTINVAKNFLTSGKEGLEGTESVITKGASVIAAAATTKELYDVDSDGNGVRDITEKGVNAYRGLKGVAEVISTVGDILT